MHAQPPKGFESRSLVLFDASGGVWRRMYQSHHPNPLGYGHGPSRFSDPNAPPRFGVIYIGSSVKVCFVETILRDRGVGRLGDLPIAMAELEAWTCAELRINGNLRMIDLRGDGLVRMRIPTDVAGARSQNSSRAWSAAFWSHNEVPDGIYHSRLNGETNIAVYDRALTKLHVAATPRLVECRSDLANIIKDFDLSLV
jgi:RES domain